MDFAVDTVASHIQPENLRLLYVPAVIRGQERLHQENVIALQYSMSGIPHFLWNPGI